MGPQKHPTFKAFRPMDPSEKSRMGKRKKSPSPEETRPKKKGKPKRSKDEDLDLTRGLENPEAKLGSVLAQIVRNKGSPIETFGTEFYVSDPSDHENEV